MGWGGGGGIRNSDVTNLNLWVNVFKASPNIHANERNAGASSSLRVFHGGSCVESPPPSTQNRFLFLFLLPVAYLNIEQTFAGISICILYRIFVANFNNLLTHPVCNLFSTNEINPRLQPHYIDAGDIIYVDILSYNLAQKNCGYRPERSIHQSSDLVGSGLRVFRGGRI